MPNIIQQQDLLKGLPDNRLAMLLQNPTGDIPPFLVAAEAQRRQFIRQQDAGTPNNESVVDTLVKQTAKVPQNLQTTPQMPPMVPPTPPMSGVAALEQQMAMEQAAQNAVAQQPQMMRAGGPVRRFNAGGLNRPSVAQIAAANPRVSDMESIFADPFSIPTMDPTEGTRIPTIRELGVPLPWAEELTPEEAEKRHREYKEREAKKRIFPKLPAGSSGGMSFDGRLDAPAAKDEEIDPNESTSPLPGETEDEYRTRLDEIMRAQEPSDWEKSQRWFAMAEQFLDPSKTNMQSIAGAGRAFAEQSAAMNAAQRQAEIDYKKAMLTYDMEELNRIKAEKSANDQARLESMKYQGEQALKEAELYRKAADDQRERKKGYEDILEEGIASEEDKAAARAAIIEIDKLITEYNRAANNALLVSQAQRYQYGKSYGTYQLPRAWDGGDELTPIR